MAINPNRIFPKFLLLTFNTSPIILIVFENITRFFIFYFRHIIRICKNKNLDVINRVFFVKKYNKVKENSYFYGLNKNQYNGQFCCISKKI